MPLSRNFDPDWDRFVRSPNYRAIVAAVSVATAIGATASAAVVLSLVDYQAGALDTWSISAKAPVAAGNIALTNAEPIVAPPAVSITPTAAQPEEEMQVPSIFSESPLGPLNRFSDASVTATPNEKEHQAARPIARDGGIHKRIAIHRRQYQFERDPRFSALFQFPHSW